MATGDSAQKVLPTAIESPLTANEVPLTATESLGAMAVRPATLGPGQGRLRQVRCALVVRFDDHAGACLHAQLEAVLVRVQEQAQSDGNDLPLIYPEE